MQDWKCLLGPWEVFVPNNYREKQSLALKELIQGQDNFFILPTISIKSLIFQSFPIVMDYVKGNQTAKSIMIVVFPLVSLKKGQVNYLNSKCIKAAYLGEGQWCKWIFKILFISIRATPQSRSHFIKWYFYYRTAICAVTFEVRKALKINLSLI